MSDEVKPVRYSNKFLISRFEGLGCTSSSCYQFCMKRDWLGLEYCSSFFFFFFTPTDAVPTCFHSFFSFNVEVYWLCSAERFKVNLKNTHKSQLIFLPVHRSSHVKTLGVHELTMLVVIQRAAISFSVMSFLGFGEIWYIAQSHSPFVHTFITCPCLQS